MFFVLFNPKEFIVGLLSTFGTDSTKEKQGAWIDIISNDDGSMCQMKIARMGSANKQFMKRYASMQKRFKGSIDGVPTDKEVSALQEAFVDTVLIDWKNVEDIRKVENETFPTPVGTVRYMEFNRPNALLLFKTLPDLFDYVVGEAGKRENFQTSENEELAKN